MSGRDVMALIPTGGGKSLTYQLPAFISRGYTFIIGPLISLCQDQCEQLVQKGIRCYFFKGTENMTNWKFYKSLLDEAECPQTKIIYLTPEKFVQSEDFIDCLKKLYKMGRIERFVIDEAHCISHWGQDFRGDYRKLSCLREKFPKVPIMALTATATIPVKADIVENLGIKDVIYFQSSFNRPNLYYEIKDKQRCRDLGQEIVSLIKTKFAGMSGIIYCFSRKHCEEMAEYISNFEIKWRLIITGRSRTKSGCRFSKSGCAERYK